MTSATEGGPAHSGDRDIEFTAASDAARPTSRWWVAVVAVLVALLVAAVGVVWWSGDGGEPAALVTATDVTTSSASSTSPPSTTASIAPTDEATSATIGPTDSASTDAPLTTPASPQRPVVPASTTTAPSASETAVTDAPSTIVVSATADANAPQVSLVDDAVTVAVVIDPVPNTSLNAADRTDTGTVPTTSAPRLDCDGPTIRLDPIALAETGDLAAESADGAAATIAVSGTGVGVVGGRDDVRIDYSADRGASERLVIALGGRRCAISIEMGDLASDEWNGAAESVHWVGLDGDNRTVGEGWLLGSASQPFDLPLVEPIERLLLEAAPYGATADGWPPGADRETNDNSDFVLLTILVR